MAATVKESAKNPKRRQRDVRKQLKHTSIGTKSQQALKLQQEQLKTERREKSREQKEADKQFRFHLKQQKKKDRHRGQIMPLPDCFYADRIFQRKKDHL